MSSRAFNHPPKRILIVCKGNICRSALAEVILRKEILDYPSLQGVEVRSAGTENYNVGRGADPSAVRIAAEHGYDLGRHIAKQVQREDIAWADLVVAMDRSNVDRLLGLFADLGIKDKVRLLMTFAREEDGDIPDPYKGDYTQFRNAFVLIHSACKEMVKVIAVQES